MAKPTRFVPFPTGGHEAEKAKLQAALDRANGERARLAYELVKMKQQAERTTAAEQVEDVMLRECTIDGECSGCPCRKLNTIGSRQRIG